MRIAARGVARLMAADDGPRIAALAFDGWDTHANEGGAVGRLAQLLGGLDGAFAEFEQGLGARWSNTVVAVITEFGRTARINGTEGTDHGTGTVALLAGGGIEGGRIIADWPGLKDANLHDGRDLKPTTDLRAVLKGVMKDHLGMSDRVLASAACSRTRRDQADAGVDGVRQCLCERRDLVCQSGGQLQRSRKARQLAFRLIVVTAYGFLRSQGRQVILTPRSSH